MVINLKFKLRHIKISIFEKSNQNDIHETFIFPFIRRCFGKF